MFAPSMSHTGTVASPAPLRVSCAKSLPTCASSHANRRPPRLCPGMFALARELSAEAVAVPLDDIAAALRLLAERDHVTAEGAGGLAVAAAVRGTEHGPVACVVSGGNIRAGRMSTILMGGTPSA